jgi:hypothetical protein
LHGTQPLIVGGRGTGGGGGGSAWAPAEAAVDVADPLLAFPEQHGV